MACKIRPAASLSARMTLEAANRPGELPSADRAPLRLGGGGPVPGPPMGAYWGSFFVDPTVYGVWDLRSSAGNL